MMFPACSMIGSFGPHLPQDAQGVEDGREGAAQFVGQQGHELFLAAVGFGEAVRPLPLGLRRLAFGEVVHHPGERPGLLRLVQQGRHGGLTPEPCAVLAHLPAHAVRPARVGGRLEFVFGLAVANVFGREEAGEVLPDDLVRLGSRTGAPHRGSSRSDCPPGSTRKMAYSFASVASRSNRPSLSCGDSDMRWSSVMASPFSTFPQRSVCGRALALSVPASPGYRSPPTFPRRRRPRA